MKPGSIKDWLMPTLGGLLMLVGAAGLAYKVISGYRHPSPDAFVSVQDQKILAASAAEHSVITKTAADVPATAQSTPTVMPIASSTAAPAIDAGATAELDASCVAIKTEQHEVESAFRNPHSAEEGRYMQRRLLQLAHQSDELNCL